MILCISAHQLWEIFGAIVNLRALFSEAQSHDHNEGIIAQLRCHFFWAPLSPPSRDSARLIYLVSLLCLGEEGGGEKPSSTAHSTIYFRAPEYFSLRIHICVCMKPYVQYVHKKSGRERDLFHSLVNTWGKTRKNRYPFGAELVTFIILSVINTLWPYARVISGSL